MTRPTGSSAPAAMQGPYDARRVESVWCAEWERRGYFPPSEDESREPFVIAIPPPNITSRLQVGHVMFVTYQDLMVRRLRPPSPRGAAVGAGNGPSSPWLQIRATPADAPKSEV